MRKLRFTDYLATDALFLAELAARGFGDACKRARSAHEARLGQRLGDFHPQRLRPVERISARDTGAMRAFHRRGTPVVIEGLYEDWPANERWNVHYFRDQYGDREFEVNVQSKQSRRTEFATRSLREIVDAFEDASTDELPYIMFSPVLSVIPELKQDIDLAAVRRFSGNSEDKKIWVKLFFGPAGTRTSLHMAPQSNLFFQVHGEKRWVMFAPGESPLVYANRILPTGLPYFFSNYGYRDEGSDERYPLADYLEGYDIHLKSGDALWVPPFHWHWVHSLTPSISLSTWWYDPLISLRCSPFFFALSTPGLLGILGNRYDVNAFDRERTATIQSRLKKLARRRVR